MQITGTSAISGIRELPAPELPPIDDRHLKIEHDHTRLALAHALERLLAVGGADDVEAVRAEQAPDELHDQGVVVDDKNRAAGAGHAVG